ncbi:MAG: CoA pyrophosphatase [Desulfobacterales bacterium]|nr:CoA pyrophosphatase [Desulfobacterales bacterium]
MKGPLDQMQRLPEHIARRLNGAVGPEDVLPEPGKNPPVPSVVLFLLGPPWARAERGPCLILNKRSAQVRQPGDLCCPGGGISPRLDGGLARLLRLPGSPLARWPHWRRWQRRWPDPSGRLALHLATALREAAEEMRLNPLGVRFLGPMRPQRLVMFRRVIYPMVGWVGGQRRFLPNWEVERIVRIPLGQLLEARRYARYRFRMEAGGRRHVQDFPCFRLAGPDGRDVLWGATYRIAVQFLETVFDFSPPLMETLPVVYGSMDSHYMTGRG